MTNKRKQRARALVQKTGMSHQAAVNVLERAKDPTPNYDRPYADGVGYVDAPGIDVENYEVARLLAPYAEQAAALIEQADRRVSHYVVNREGITAHAVDGRGEPVQVDFHSGVHKMLIILSRAPRVRRPPRTLVAEMLHALDDVLFGSDDPSQSKHEIPGRFVYMNPEDYACVRYAHGGAGSGRLDPTVRIELLRSGYQGCLMASTASFETRHQDIYVHRETPKGLIHIAPTKVEPGAPLLEGTRIRIAPEPEKVKTPCCERDHDGDGNCDRHRVDPV